MGKRAGYISTNERIERFSDRAYNAKQLRQLDKSKSIVIAMFREKLGKTYSTEEIIKILMCLNINVKPFQTVDGERRDQKKINKSLDLISNAIDDIVDTINYEMDQITNDPHEPNAIDWLIITIKGMTYDI